MKSRTSASLILLLVFVLGGVSGAVGYWLFHKQAIATAAAKPPGRRGPGDVTEEMSRTLSLDAAQKEKLTAIITQSRESYRALSVQFRPQYDAIRNQTNQQIREILNEEQKARFEKMIQEMSSRHRDPRRPGPPGPSR